ncbi:glycosyltransferase family 4 protein [Paraglaciecola aquimarina]|uniref:Glycosyltransferase family 4 protein n=1 Tax=Paraglaciecola algarum TaxID=3050085 RepID=A0ABS9D6V9_9ALTE|nr:glycosyltransferase family 4 protein [Paraglaciecola sp. G1-23]
MNLKIGIYIEAVKVSSKTGISRHIIGLVEALVNENSLHEYYLYYQIDLFEKETLNWLNEVPQVTLRPLRFPNKWIAEHPTLWWKYYLPLNIWKDKIDVFHGPNHFIPLSGNTAKVVTIHDLAYYYMEVHGEGLDRVLKNWTNKAMDIADKIITVSQSTADDCIKEGAPTDKVKVVYQGFEPAIILENETEQETPVKPYILYVGTIQPRKNVEYIVQSFAKVKDNIPHDLILAGAPGDSIAAVNKLISDLKIQDRVTLTGYISDERRHLLYKHADMFVYPSKYEGFGLVLLEAMSYGIPVITASNSSLMEAAGDAALYCDGTTTSSLVEAINQLSSNDKLRNKLIENGYQQIKKFTWKTCAVQMLTIYELAITERQSHKKNNN